MSLVFLAGTIEVMLLFFIMILNNCLLRSFIATWCFALVSRCESL